MSRFKVGDRVRSKEYPQGLAGTVVRTDDDFVCVVAFDDWVGGWYDGEHDEKKPSNRWGFDSPEIDLILIAPASAQFQVVYMEDGDETYDTEKAAELRAEELAAAEPGLKVAILKLVSTTKLGLSFERFA